MLLNQSDSFEVVNTTRNDLHNILWLFNQAINQQEKIGYKAWNEIDKSALEKDIENGLQYKIINGSDLLVIFSIQLNDPFIWGERDQNDAVYLHRIVVNPKFKGQKQFQKVLNWAIDFAKSNNLQYIRMDTWADNQKIIEYYQSFGFKFIKSYTTPNVTELPIQNRNLHVALLELPLTG